MKANLGTVDRAIRVALGVVLVGAGLAVVKRVFALGLLLGVALGLAGAVLIFSGTVGFCHVYKVLGIRSSKRE